MRLGQVSSFSRPIALCTCQRRGTWTQLLASDFLTQSIAFSLLTGSLRLCFQGAHISIIWLKSSTETSKLCVNLSKFDDFSSDSISDWDEMIEFVVLSSQLTISLLKILACIVSTCEVCNQGLGSSAGYLIQCHLANSIDF